MPFLRSGKWDPVLLAESLLQEEERYFSSFFIFWFDHVPEVIWDLDVASVVEQLLLHHVPVLFPADEEGVRCILVHFSAGEVTLISLDP